MHVNGLIHGPICHSSLIHQIGTHSLNLWSKRFYLLTISSRCQKISRLHRPNSDHQYILLGGKKLNNVYANSDATWTFSNWYAFQPAGEECIFASDIMGYGWNTTSCSTNGYAICQLNTSLPFEGKTYFPI